MASKVKLAKWSEKAMMTKNGTTWCYLAFLLLFLALSKVHAAPSFSCDGASSLQKQLICTDKSLAALEAQVSGLYELALAIIQPNKALKAEQASWLLRTRDRCLDVTCLANAYTQRSEPLFRLLNKHTTPLVRRLSGTVTYGVGESSYCKLSNVPSYFSISVVPQGNRVEAHVDGVHDCGRKLWGGSFSGRFRGNVAVVRYTGGSHVDRQAKAFVALHGNRLHWLIFDSGREESYAPHHEVVRVARR